MKKLVVAAAAALTMTAATAVLADGRANAATYASLEGVPKLTIQLSGGCSGSFTLDNMVMAGIWDIPGTGSTISGAEQMAGAVAIFQNGGELFPIMAGSFNPGYNYSVTRNAKGETFKLTATAFIRADDLYKAILANSANISCKAGSFANAVAKYPSMGSDYDDYLPFNAGGAQFQQKSGKVTYQLTNTSTIDGEVVERSNASYKHNIAIAGAFVGAPVCSVKGTVAVPTSLACKAGAPINVKVSLKATGADLFAIDL